jgi:hypothetical protein
MHTYIVLFTLLTFHSVAVSAGLQEILNVAKCISDIHQELPNSCVYIMKTMDNNKMGGILIFFLYKYCVFENIYSNFESSKAASLIENTLLE